MASETRVAANRRNAQKSMAPRTAAGKAESSSIALRHARPKPTLAAKRVSALLIGPGESNSESLSDDLERPAELPPEPESGPDSIT